MKSSKSSRKRVWCLSRKRRIAAAAVVTALAVFTGGCARMDAKTAYTKGCEALEAGNFEEAEGFFESAIEAGYFLPEAYRGKGLSEMSRADYSDAAISLEKSLLYVENQDEAFQRDTSLYLAQCRERQGRTDKAMEILSSLILKSPDAETLFLRGKLNLRLGNSKEAKDDFNQAVAMDPGYDLYINIYQVYEDADRSGDGSQYLELALTEANKDSEDYYEQGLVNYYLQNYREAREMLIQATRQNPDDGKAVFLLGQVYLATGDIADARALYRQYTNNMSTAAGAFNGLALCDIASVRAFSSTRLFSMNSSMTGQPRSKKRPPTSRSIRPTRRESANMNFCPQDKERQKRTTAVYQHLKC